jgi:hypothetical protein
MSKKSKKEQEELVQKTILGLLKKNYDDALAEPDEGQRLIKLDDVRQKAELAGVEAKKPKPLTGFGNYLLGYTATATPIMVAGDMFFGGLPVFTLLGIGSGWIVGSIFRDKKRDKVIAERAGFIAAIKEIEDDAAFGVNSLVRQNVMDYAQSPALPEIFTRFPKLKEKFVAAQTCKNAKANQPKPGASSKGLQHE